MFDILAGLGLCEFILGFWWIVTRTVEANEKINKDDKYNKFNGF